MSRIDRNNYEIWFIDYMDGILSDESEKQLFAFLEKNPDLAEELDKFEELTLQPADISFDAASRLQKSEADVMQIARPDFLMIKQLEDGLTEAEGQELAEEIRKDESLIRKGREYRLTRLAPELIEYAGKHSLIRKEIRPMLIQISRITAAAAAVIFVMIFGLKVFNSVPDEDTIALHPLEPLPADINETVEIEKDLKNILEPYNSAKLLSSRQKVEYSVSDIQDDIKRQNTTIESSGTMDAPMVPLPSRGFDQTLFVSVPNVYEAGLRHMMPMYLDLNREKQNFIAENREPASPEETNSILVRGIQFVDKVSGDLVNFDKLYDEDGNFVAYNLKAGGFEVEKKLRK